MSLEPFFSLSPSSPRAHTYDPANPDAPYVYGAIYSFGGYTGYVSPWRLGDQTTNDEIILGYDAVEPAETLIGSPMDDIYRRCVAACYFAGHNVNSENQYLLIFELRGINGSPSAQFFVGSEWIRTEELSGDEQVAILLDTPGNEIGIYVYIRLAATTFSSNMAFKGVVGYLL